MPRALTRLVRPPVFTAAYPALSFWLPTSYPAPSFWLSTPAGYPARTSQLVTRRALERSANARPITPSIYPAGAPAGVHGSLPGSKLLAPDSKILALDSCWLPCSNLPTCYPASSRVVYKRKTHYLLPRAFTRPVRPLGFTAACPALSFWLPTP